MKMFTKASVLVALLAVASVTARPSGDEPKDAESPRIARTTSYHGANTRVTSQDRSDQQDTRTRREYSDVGETRTKIEEEKKDYSKSKSEVNLKFTEPVLKNIHEHVPTEPSTQVVDDAIQQLVSLYSRQPVADATSQSVDGDNSPMLAAIRNYENPVTSYLKNNPLNTREGSKNVDNSNIRRHIVHQQTLIAPYSQYVQQLTSQGNRPGYLLVNPTVQPNGGSQQNTQTNQNFNTNPNTVGSPFQNIRPQNGNNFMGFQNLVQNENNENSVLSQNFQVNSNTLPLVRPSYQNSPNNNFDFNSRISNNIGPYSGFYSTGSSQPQQHNGYQNTGSVSPYTSAIYQQNYQNQNYGNLYSNLKYDPHAILQPSNIQYSTDSGASSYLPSPSYSNNRNWRPNQPTNSFGYEYPLNTNGYSQSVNRNAQQMVDGRQYSIPWPFAQYFPIVIKDPLVSMLSGFTSMIEYGPGADVCKPLDSKEGNTEEVAHDAVDNSSPSEKDEQKDPKTRAKRLLDVAIQKVKDIEAKGKANEKVGTGVGFEKAHEKQNEKSKSSANLQEEVDLTILKPPPVKSQNENPAPRNVEIARSVELDVGKIFDQGKLHKLGIEVPLPKPVVFAPQVAESMTVEARLNTSETTPKSEPETRNAKDEFEIINVNLPKQDGGLFQGRQDVPEVAVDEEVELINVNRKPGNVPPPVAPKPAPEGRISDDVEVFDVNVPKPEKLKVESLKEEENVGVDQERSKGGGAQVINTDQALSATLEVLEDDPKQEGGEDSEKESEDEDEEGDAEDEDSEEDDETKPDVEVQTEPPTTGPEVNEDPKQEEPGVILTTGSHGNYGPVIRRLVVRKGGVAIAGPGGIATAGPGGVAVVGPGGTAYTRPNGVAIVGPGGKVVGLPNDMVFEHGGVAVIHKDGSEPRRVTTDKNGLPLGARVLAYGPTVYFHPPDLLI